MIVVSFAAGFISRNNHRSEWCGTFFGKWSTFNCCKGWYNFFRTTFNCCKGWYNFFRTYFLQNAMCRFSVNLTRIIERKGWGAKVGAIWICGMIAWFSTLTNIRACRNWVRLFQHYLLPGSYKALGHSFWRCGFVVGVRNSSGETLNNKSNVTYKCNAFFTFSLLRPLILLSILLSFSVFIYLAIYYWMGLSRIWRILQVEPEGVIHRGHRG